MGRIIYTERNNVSVILSSSDRPKITSEDPLKGDSEELAAAFNTFDAYSGEYAIDEESQSIIHTIHIARFPNWINTQQTRYYHLSDNQLTLKTPPIKSLDNEWIATLIWSREE